MIYFGYYCIFLAYTYIQDIFLSIFCLFLNKNSHDWSLWLSVHFLYDNLAKTTKEIILFWTRNHNLPFAMIISFFSVKMKNSFPVGQLLLVRTVYNSLSACFGHDDHNTSKKDHFWINEVGLLSIWKQKPNWTVKKEGFFLLQTAAK